MCFCPNQRIPYLFSFGLVKCFTQNFIHHPTPHTKLLEGQRKQSCTGQILKDTYYLFEYVNKHNPNDTGAFYCGYHAPELFLN